MSSEKILIINRYLISHSREWKVYLESSPEHYNVAIARDYSEGDYMLRLQPRTESERFRLAIIDADEVDTYALELVTNIRGTLHQLPVLVLTSCANSTTRRSLTLLATECMVKTGDYDQFLWRSVQTSLARNNGQRPRTRMQPFKIKHPFPFTKKRAQ